MKSVGLGLAAALLGVVLAGCGEEPIPVGKDGCPVRDVVLVRDITVDDMVGRGRMGPAASQEFHILLGPEWPAGARWSCIKSISASIAWENGATAGADLYVGLEDPDAGVSVVGQDNQQLPGDGANVETVLAPQPEDPEALEDGLLLIVYSDWASLSGTGLHVQATLTLDVPAGDS